MGASIKYSYKLWEEIANGVRFFGVDYIKNGAIYAKCVCPTCSELWTTKLGNVKLGLSKQCLSCGRRQSANARWKKGE